MSSVKLDIKKCLSRITEDEKSRLKKWLENEKIKEAIDDSDWQFLYDNKYLVDNCAVTSYIITTLISSIGIDVLKKLKDIETDMFSGLYIDSIEIDSSTGEVGYRAFYKAVFSDTNISIPAGVKLGYHAFSDSNISHVKLDCDDMSNGCFSDCSSLQEVEIGPNVKNISYKCFMNCVNLSNVKIDDSIPVENIFKNAFDGCTNLKHIEYRGQVFTSVNKFKNYISDYFKNNNPVKSTWYRINNGMHGYSGYVLTCHYTKTKGIVASMTQAINTGRGFSPIFFRSEKDAKKFIKNNPNTFSRFGNLNVYKAVLNNSVDVGFVKVKTDLGDCYVQSHRADDLNLQPGTYTIEV